VGIASRSSDYGITLIDQGIMVINNTNVVMVQTNMDMDG